MGDCFSSDFILVNYQLDLEVIFFLIFAYPDFIFIHLKSQNLASISAKGIAFFSEFSTKFKDSTIWTDHFFPPHCPPSRELLFWTTTAAGFWPITTIKTFCQP